MRSFDGRAEPVDSGREELVVAILNAFRTNMFNGWYGCSWRGRRCAL